MLALTEADADKTFDLATGDSVEIRLPENATAGYRWTIEAIDNSICDVTADERQAPAKVVPGAPGSHFWRLKALRAGDCRIAIAYRRSWAADAPPAREFKLRLRVRA